MGLTRLGLRLRAGLGRLRGGGGGLQGRGSGRLLIGALPEDGPVEGIIILVVQRAEQDAEQLQNLIQCFTQGHKREKIKGKFSG